MVSSGPSVGIMRAVGTTTGPQRATWTDRGMLALLTMTLAGFSGYAVLLPVAPLWAVHGGADEGGSGLVNGVLLLSTVLTQLTVPGLLRRFGWERVLASGLVLLGLPSLALLASDALGPVLAVSAVRGTGFGILTVTGSAAVAELVDPARRGAAVGAYGLAIAAPQVVLLPLGPWVAEHLTFTPVLALGALPLLGVAPAIALGRVLDAADRDAATVPEASSDPSPAAGRTPLLVLLRPMLLLLGVTLAGGAVITFAPQMIDHDALVAAALAILGLTAALSRWRIGAVADRLGPHRFVAPLVVLTTVSTGVLALAVAQGSAPLFLVAAAALGLAYGGLQNLTLLLAFATVPRREYGRASAIWNVGFDLGTGLGSVLVGLVAARADFPAALLLAAGVSLATLPLALGRRPARASA